MAEPFSIDGQYWAHLFCEEVRLSEQHDSKAAGRGEREESLISNRRQLSIVLPASHRSCPLLEKLRLLRMSVLNNSKYPTPQLLKFVPMEFHLKQRENPVTLVEKVTS